MKSLNVFTTQSEYEKFLNGSAPTFPTISYCSADGKCHVNSVPSVTIAIDVLNVDEPTIVCTNHRNVSSIIIDKVEQDTISTAYTFSNIGEHTVKFILNTYALEDGMFANKDNYVNIKKIKISNSVVRIGKECFLGCPLIKDIVIPKNIMYIEDGAFLSCKNLSSVSLPKSLLRIDSNLFYKCVKLSDVNIPKDVTMIGDNAFHQCTSLSTINIPSKVTMIGDNAFYFCGALKAIYISAFIPPKLGDNVFEGTSCPIYVPNVSIDAYKSNWGQYSERIKGNE